MNKGFQNLHLFIKNYKRAIKYLFLGQKKNPLFYGILLNFVICIFHQLYFI